MSIAYTCDYCSEEIGDEPYMQIDAGWESGSKKDRGGWGRGYLGHYHSSAWRGCYRTVRASLLGLHGQGETAGLVRSPDDEWRERRAKWQRKPRAERVHLVLNALGDDRLTLRELAARLAERLDGRVYESDIRRMVYRLHDAGELERVGERRASGDKPGAIRYRFLRRRELSGPISDLERAFNDDQGGLA